MNYVYLLRCSDDSLYCGWTNDLAARVDAHDRGRGAKYTRSRRPVELVYAEEHEDKRDALRREWYIKHMSRAEKLALISNQRSDIRNGCLTPDITALLSKDWPGQS